MKKIVYVDMDNVLVDFPSGIARLDEKDKAEFQGSYDDCPRIFALMDPMPDAIESYRELAELFDTYILSTSPWANHQALVHKLEWVKHHLGADKGDPAYKRLIFSHRKDLNKGDFLIDDRTKNGASEFEGQHIHFGQSEFPDWQSVMTYLRPIA